MFDSQEQCDSNCFQHCLQGWYDILTEFTTGDYGTDIKTSNYNYKLYYVCPKGYQKTPGNTIIAPPLVTTCESSVRTYDYYNLRVDMESSIQAPELMNCSNATKSLAQNENALMQREFAPAPGLKWCAFAYTLSECQLYCKKACTEDWAAGIYKRTLTYKNINTTTEMGIIPPF